MQKGQHWKNWLAQQWVVRTCEQFDLDKILMDPDRDKDEYEVLANFRKQFEHSSIDDDRQRNNKHWAQIFLNETFTLFAARLGNEWAMINFPSNFLEQSMTAFMGEKYAWLQSGETLKKTLIGPDLLRATLDFILAVEETNIELNWDRLVENVCAYSCENLIKLVNEDDEIIYNNSRARALDKLEQHARRLGRFYDKEL